MHLVRSLIAGVCLSTVSLWAQAPAQHAQSQQCEPGSAQPSCVAPAPGQPAAPVPIVSPQDKKAAKKAFKRGLKLKKADPEEALDAFEQASQLDPADLEYATAREIVRQQLVMEHLRKGDEAMLSKRTVEAAAEFRKALAFDPSNQSARQRLADATAPPASSQDSWLKSSLASDETFLTIKPGVKSFHFSADTRQLFTTIANSFGVKAVFDEELPSRRVQLDLDHASFYAAMDAACSLTHTFWTPLSATDILIAQNTPAKHKELDRYVLRTFYLPEATTPQELTDIANMFRSMLDLKYITQSPSAFTVTVRGPRQMVDAAAELLASLHAGRPQVMLDVETFEVNRQMLSSIGLDLPLQFQIFNIPAAALASLGQQNTQDLINQLIASGGINQANSTAISALLAQLQNQQSALLANPLATFGRGVTLFGIGIPPATAHFSLNESRVVNLEHVTLRAAQGNAATFRLGTRYPILNATYAPIYNSPQISQVLGNLSYIAPFPSFNYEDLGLTLKAKPMIHGDTDVTLDMELELKTLGAQSFNGIPVIANRSYKGVITVKNNEPAVVAGMLTKSEQDSLRGMPGLGQIPVLGRTTGSQNKQKDEAELLVVITPRILNPGVTGGPKPIRVPKMD